MVVVEQGVESSACFVCSLVAGEKVGGLVAEEWETEPQG